jgi:hypothetical protein
MLFFPKLLKFIVALTIDLDKKYLLPSGFFLILEENIYEFNLRF